MMWLKAVDTDSFKYFKKLNRNLTRMGWKTKCCCSEMDVTNLCVLWDILVSISLQLSWKGKNMQLLLQLSSCETLISEVLQGSAIVMAIITLPSRLVQNWRDWRENLCKYLDNYVTKPLSIWGFVINYFPAMIWLPQSKVQTNSIYLHTYLILTRVPQRFFFFPSQALLEET